MNISPSMQPFSKEREKNAPPPGQPWVPTWCHTSRSLVPGPVSNNPFFAGNGEPLFFWWLLKMERPWVSLRFYHSNFAFQQAFHESNFGFQLWKSRFDKESWDITCMSSIHHDWKRMNAGKSIVWEFRTSVARTIDPKNNILRFVQTKMDLDKL